MTDVYVKINGVEYATGRKTPNLITKQGIPIHEPDRDHPLVRKSKRAIKGYYYSLSDPVCERIITCELEGNFNEAEVASLIDDPYQMFKSEGRQLSRDWIACETTWWER